MRASGFAIVVVLAVAAPLVAQGPSPIDALVAAVRPALPFPAAGDDGALPADGGAAQRWFVVWPAAPEDLKIAVKSNPLHPETQKLGAVADVPIQEAVAAAERKAQAAYDRALEQLKRGDAVADFDSISLEDEGIAGQRIDAELELTIELQPSARSFAIDSSEAPQVSAGPNGVAWVVTTAPNAYRPVDGLDRRERFRPAEARLYFGSVSRPSVARHGNGVRFDVSIPAGEGAVAVVLRGNHELLKRVLATADWARLSRTRP